MVRTLLALVAATAIVLGAGAVAGFAQESSTAADATFATPPGLPEIRITTTDVAYEGVPEQVSPGRYLVTLDNRSSAEAAAEFLMLPPGISYEQALGFFSGLEAGADASPAAGSTAAQTEMVGGPPDWFYQVYMAGGPYAEFAGQTVQAVVDLPAGEYLVWPGDPSKPQLPARLIVSDDGGEPRASPEPAADVVITEVGTAEGYAFEINGTFVAGPQSVRIDNKSDQPHFVVFIRTTEPVTAEGAMALLMEDPTAVVDWAGSGTQSAGTTQWIATNLEPGTYVVACFIPDPANGGIPHAAEDMIEVVTVADAGTLAA
jgi:hypothetical protein